jgi:hypothetical protein
MKQNVTQYVLNIPICFLLWGEVSLYDIIITLNLVEHFINATHITTDTDNV